MNWQRALPGVVIGAIVLFALSRLRGGQTQVYNALVPSSTYTPPDRDAARTAAFDTLAGVGLGQLRLDQAANEATQALSLARDRIAGSLDLARINAEAAQNRLTAELTDRQYDRELQRRALDQTFALGQTGQIGNALPGILQSILGAIRGGQQSQQRPSGGGSSPQSPPFNPNANRQPTANRPANWNLVQRAIDRYLGRNSPVSAGDYQIYGNVPYIDLSPWDWAFGYGESGFDYWNRYYDNNYFLNEPIFSTSVEGYSLYDPRGWWHDWGFQSESDLWDWYAIDPDYFNW